MALVRVRLLTKLCDSFCEIDHAPGTSFGCQLSLSKATVLALLHKYQISPQYLSLLLGEPDYWAPGDFASVDPKGKLNRTGKSPARSIAGFAK